MIERVINHYQEGMEALKREEQVERMYRLLEIAELNRALEAEQVRDKLRALEG